jgi:hypothetical protein
MLRVPLCPRLLEYTPLIAYSNYGNALDGEPHCNRNTKLADLEMLYGKKSKRSSRRHLPSSSCERRTAVRRNRFRS